MALEEANVPGEAAGAARAMAEPGSTVYSFCGCLPSRATSPGSGASDSKDAQQFAAVCPEWTPRY